MPDIKETKSPLDLIPQVAREHAAKLKAERDKPQRRIMIVGVSGSGKTYAAATAPNPIYFDYDNQLNDPVVRNRLSAVFPMWNTAHIKDMYNVTGSPEERLKLLIKKYVAQTLTCDHTIIIDSASQFGDGVKDVLKEKFPDKGGDSSYRLWETWAAIWRSLCGTLRDLPCNVIVTFHENEIRDETTNSLEKYGWMMQGKEFTPRIPQFFTDVVRQVHVVKENKTSGTLENEEWLWQIKPTEKFPNGKSRCTTKAITIPANWQSIIK